VARATHLLDTSALTRLSRPAVANVLVPLIGGGRAALCAPVAFELGYSARTAADHGAVMAEIDAFEQAPVTDADHWRAIEVQGRLAERAQHRAVSLVDALVAAVAEARGLTVLHYDADFELITEVTGQPTEWVVPRASVD